MASLRIRPKAGFAERAETSLGGDSFYGVHDSLRDGLKTVRGDVIPGHPLESSLNKWNETQDELHLNLAQRLHGAHMPIRIQMERFLLSQPKRIPVLKTSNLALDILAGRDESIEFEDFLGDADPSLHIMDVHGTMERTLGHRRAL
ncbi:proteasome maturation factor UMP1-domain-containing protein [Chytridium lagenaria]|nr:proteasome maturation factor UMP1-domain-containing protein [Chytridium lagenaria]